MQKWTYNIRMAVDSIAQRPLRSLLTSLGIVFGVGAVIAMMAIGQGGQAAIVEQMRMLGSDNLIIEPIIQQSEAEVQEDEEKEDNAASRFSPGLSMADVRAIQQVVPGVKSVSPELVLDVNVMYGGKKRSGKVIGVQNAFFEQPTFKLDKGLLFTTSQSEGAAAVCVIGHGIKTKFFAQENPIGKSIKAGKNWLTVIGVAQPRFVSQASRDELGIRDLDMDIYVPLETALLRYQDRQRVTSADLEQAASRMDRDEDKSKPLNYHQIDRLVVSLEEGADIFSTAEVVRRLLFRRHNDVIDAEVKIPEEILAQKQAATDIYNMVLISIAALSLLIGGIGIMNIMLASVMERTKEIGVRLSLGATKRDIMIQFLGEAVALSLAGGILGVMVGFGLSFGIEKLSGVKAIVTGFSIFIAFFVSVFVGILFGSFPARKAARQDPVISLRYE